MGVKAIGQFTIKDFHDVYSNATPPTNPVKDMLWLDTSVKPPLMKVWNGKTWEVANDYSGDIDNLVNITTTHNTSINVVKGQITTLIQDTTITKDGQTTKLKDEYNKTVVTVNSINSTIASQQTTIDSNTGNITRVDTKANNIQRDLDGTKSTVSSHTTQINGLNSTVSNQGSSITQLQNKIALKVEQSDITTAVDNIDVGGRNLLLRSSFLYTSLPIGCNFEMFTVNNIASSEFTKDGYHYTALANNGAPNSSRGVKIKSTNLGIKVGDTITYSCDIKGKFGSSNNGLALMHATTTNSNFYARIFPGKPHGLKIEQWTRVYNTYTIPNNIKIESDGSFFIYIFWGGGTGSEVDVYTKNTKIEKGNKNTDWTPATEDIDASINSVDSKLTTTNNKVASIETALDSITQRVSSTETTTSTINATLTTTTNTANAAKSTADTAKTNAQTAQNTANSANSLATTANNTANTAKTNAQNAQNTANNANGKIDGLQIGSENLLRNGNFVKLLEFWSAHDMSTSGTNKSVRVEGGGDWVPMDKKALVINGTNTNDRYGVMSSNITLIPNTKYIVSGYCASHRTTNLQINIRENASANVKALNITATTGGKTLDKWTRFEMEFTTTSATIYNLNLYTVRCLDDAYAWFVDVKIEKGNRATAFTPCSADVDAAINAVSVEITKTNTKVAEIKSTVDSITQRVSSTETTTATINATLTTTTNTANTAKSTADTANSTANTAQNTANSANSLAGTANSTANTAKDSATNANNKIDGLQVGGRNIFRYSGNFGATISDYWVNNNGGLTVDTVNTFNGFNTIRTTVGNGITGAWYKLENNVEYTYSIMVKCNEVFTGNYNVPLHYWAGLNNASQGKIQIISYDATYPKVNVWKRLHLTFKLTEDANSFKPFIYWGSGTRVFNIAYMKLEKGNKATDWTPAPEDVDTAITNVTAEITKTNNKVASIETNISSITQRVSATESATTTINGKITNHETRIKTAESKITDSAIINTVTNTINTAKNEAINSANSSTDNKLKSYATTSSLTQTESNITAKFESAGGYNLLRNGNARNGTSFWTHKEYNLAGSDLARLFNIRNDYWTNYEYAFQLQINTMTGGEYGFSQRFATVIGKKYVFTCYLAGHRSNKNVIIRGTTSSDEGWVANKAYGAINGGTDYNAWVKVVLPFTAQRTTTSVEIDITSTIGADGYVWVKELMVSEGSVWQPFTPNPNEVYSGSTIIDANGVTVNNGALTVKNKAGTTVLSGDSDGNIRFAGTITGSHADFLDTVLINGKGGNGWAQIGFRSSDGLEGNIYTGNGRSMNIFAPSGFYLGGGQMVMKDDGQKWSFWDTTGGLSKAITINPKIGQISCTSSELPLTLTSINGRVQTGVNLYVNGSCNPMTHATGGMDLGAGNLRWYTLYCVTSINTSDIKYKKNIEYVDKNVEPISTFSVTKEATSSKYIDFIKNDLKVAEFDYTRNGKSRLEDHQIGFIAQDIINTDIGSKFCYEIEEGLGFSESGYITVVAKALQDALKKIDDLEEKVKSLINI